MEILFLVFTWQDILSDGDDGSDDGDDGYYDGGGGGDELERQSLWGRLIAILQTSQRIHHHHLQCHH